MKDKKEYNIRLASTSDIKAIMAYIHEHWRENHIMSRDLDLFLYEFKEKESINMILAVDENSGEIVGIHGFMKTALNSKLFDVWGSFWHVRQDVRAPMLGAMLIRSLKKFIPYRNRTEIGINKKTTEKIYKVFFKDNVSLMKHYYILNKSYKNDFKVAKVVEKLTNVSFIANDGVLFKKITEPSLIDFSYINSDIEKVPYKNSDYLIKRYFNHPRYDYNVYEFKGKSSMGLLVGREVDVLSRKVFRIIDYIGDENLLSYSGEFFLDLLNESKYEYIDLYNFGLNQSSLEKAGFTIRTPDDKNIIPNYFSPFVQENIDIYVSYKNESVLFFKGDGDQDRPN